MNGVWNQCVAAVRQLVRGTDHGKPPSLRGLLLGSLLVPLLALVAVATMASFYSARTASTRSFDRALLDPIQALRQRIAVVDGHPVLRMSVDSERSLFTHVYDIAWFQIRDDSGHMFAGDLQLPLPRRLGNRPVFYDAVYQGYAVRVGAMRVALDNEERPEDRPRYVVMQIAETLVRRDRNLYELMALMISPVLVIALAAVVLVSHGVSRGLRPLAVLQREIAARSHRDLRPVPEDHVPLEVRPVIASLNGLLAELSSVIEGQQRFLANAAHQLRTPLAGLQTQVELLLRQPQANESRQVLDTLLGATRRATHLANQLLALARAEPGAQYLLNMQPVNLADLIEAGMAGWLAQARVKNIDLGFELEPVQIAGDPLLLGEMIANLVDNALRYTEQEGEITVRCHDGDTPVLEVEDNGVGIPENQRDKVLERFYRIEGSSGNGCGLGLSIVAEIVRQHQARLVISTPPGGRGTRMTVYFPAEIS